ncbi:hypothetical protein U1839_24125 [Sphingomonas sp. RT2P30]|uniref:hypothetical protein n=1 Tax=Parasphingomonas halimpatiens TaxID=3096162 RepID=UPI002FC889CF
MSIMGSKPLASLSSGLLARKGQARPAMRPQGYGGFGAIPGQQDDLGWNDMGHDVPQAPHVAQVPPVVRQQEQLQEEFAPVPRAYEPPAAPIAPPAASHDEVEEQEEALAPRPAPVSEAAPAPAPAPVDVVRSVSVATATRLDRETAAKTKHGKAAFTLRLDHDRHLRLRIASALCHRSAQNLVTEALDAFLHSLPEVGALVSQLPPPKARR